jgi:UDP-N-acetylmuramoyl-L-alanyl-D-glutamate--2,6-diaminopimelate ligase
MQLSTLLTGTQILETIGLDAAKIEIKEIQFDSRKVAPGDVFVAIKGVTYDGHDYIETAIKKGAVAVVCETLPNINDTNNQNALNQSTLTVIRVLNAAETLGKMAANFYKHPSKQMKLVGITGTNGKTTTATLLHQLFTGLGYKVGLIGTVENRIGTEILKSTHTTPDAVRLQGLFKVMADAGCSHIFMEVSSHAVHQKRIAGAHFVGGIFTNLTQDHLDYHRTFAEYRDAKKEFFDHLPSSAFALTNADDKNGAFMLQNTKAKKKSYGLKKIADYRSKIIENALEGLQLRLDGEQFHARLIGEFNAYNLTAVYATAELLGLEKIEILTVLSNLQGAEGRFEYFMHPTKKCIGIVDYAHTPDAVEKVLETIQKLKKRSAKVITVIGCGGDRDKTKRPIMAQTAASLSNQLILTNDNPRTENPLQILADMEAGLTPEQLANTLTLDNREQAIKTACKMAAAGDIILVAGKGHEKYQDIMGVKHDFDDMEMLKKYLI